MPVEPSPETHNLDPDRVESAITSRTRAIIAVHLYGQPADMHSLRKIADERGVWLVEDAAQAHGAGIDGRRVGGIGHLAAWSFYPAKNLGAVGDGGAVTTDDDRLADLVRRLRNYGSTEKYVHPMQGVNSRLDEIQAAVLRVKLRHLDRWNARRRAVAKRYLAETSAQVVGLPVVPPWAEPVWHQFVVRTEERDRLLGHLRDDGIGAMVHYPVPPHRQDAYRSLDVPPQPIADGLASEVLSLPMGPHLADADVDKVVQSMARFVE